MNKLFLILSVTLLIISVSCKKQAGQGGQATIQGKVYLRKMSPSFQFIYQTPAENLSVYIIYGDDLTYGANTNTSPDGVYQFQYLRKGSYKIYVYSNDSAGTVGPPINASAPKIAVYKEVNVTSKKQTVDVSPIISYY